VKLKTLFFDVETAPLLAYVWRLNQKWINPEAIAQDSFMLTWSARWREEGAKVASMAVSSREAKDQNDTRIIRKLGDLVREADIVVAHNVDRFDVPRLNTRLLLLEEEPLGPVRTIDTLTLARKNFDLPSNKLDYLARVLGLGGKVGTTFDLWKRSVQGEAAAIKEMRTYNEQDVVLLEQVFDKLLPYVRNLGRLYDADEENQMMCPTCGGDDLIKRGHYRTQASTFQRWQCNGCGRYTRSRTAEKDKKIAVHPL